MTTAGGASTFLPLGGPLLGLVLPALIHLCFCLHHFSRAVGRIFLDVAHRATPVCYSLYSLPASELQAFLGFDPQPLVFPLLFSWAFSCSPRPCWTWGSHWAGVVTTTPQHIPGSWRRELALLFSSSSLRSAISYGLLGPGLRDQFRKDELRVRT